MNLFTPFPLVYDTFSSKNQAPTTPNCKTFPNESTSWWSGKSPNSLFKPGQKRQKKHGRTLLKRNLSNLNGDLVPFSVTSNLFNGVLLNWKPRGLVRGKKKKKAKLLKKSSFSWFHPIFFFSLLLGWMCLVKCEKMS